MNPFVVKHKQSGEVFTVLSVYPDSDGTRMCLIASGKGVMKEMHILKLCENYLWEG